jgi:hypothetical protein
MTGPTESDQREPLDDSTLAEVAHLICGDDGPLVYRKGWELSGFFRRAGWDAVPDHDGSIPRHPWTHNLLRERQRRSDADIDRVLLRLADRREYQAQEREFQASVQRLNEILRLEGLRITLVNGRPKLMKHDAEDEALTGSERRMSPIELKVAVEDVVSDPALARAVARRLEEARICYENGAYISAVIMLGSLLEGVLVHAAEARPSATSHPKALRNMGLQDLVKFAHSNGWIEPDAGMAMELVRHYRNSVHPHQEKRTGHVPNQDTLDMCWPIVNAILNDLAATKPPR